MKHDTSTDIAIPINALEAILDMEWLSLRETGEYVNHFMKCWQSGTVGACCPEWVQRAWAKAKATNFYGLRRLGRWEKYRSGWHARRIEVLARDVTCKACGAAGRLDVHHRIPRRKFEDISEADQLSNLVALCRRCHVQADHAYRRNGEVFR